MENWAFEWGRLFWYIHAVSHTCLKLNRAQTLKNQFKVRNTMSCVFLWLSSYVRGKSKYKASHECFVVQQLWSLILLIMPYRG